MGRQSAAAGRRNAEPSCRLVRFDAADGVELVGLLYEPKRASTRAVIWLHGTGGASIFDARRTNILGAELTARGIAFFPFNNRGAQLVRRLRKGEKRIDGGSAHEVIRDCVPDIDGAIRELRARGYRDITLAGHSTGANKIAVYDHYKPRNAAKRYVLLAGGDDTGLLYEQLGARRFRAALEKSREMIRARRGHELVPQTISPMMMSWRALRDMADPDGDYNVFPFLEVLRGVRLGRRKAFRYVAAIRKPVLVLYGERDEYSYDDVPACVAALADRMGANAELAIVAEADHGFSGKEEELASLIANWIE
jgi:pimeloyl-ACP methyl ester carboxylesterase